MRSFTLNVFICLFASLALAQDAPSTSGGWKDTEDFLKWMPSRFSAIVAVPHPGMPASARVNFAATGLDDLAKGKRRLYFAQRGGDANFPTFEEIKATLADGKIAGEFRVVSQQMQEGRCITWALHKGTVSAAFDATFPMTGYLVLTMKGTECLSRTEVNAPEGGYVWQECPASPMGTTGLVIRLSRDAAGPVDKEGMQGLLDRRTSIEAALKNACDDAASSDAYGKILDQENRRLSDAWYDATTRQLLGNSDESATRQALGADEKLGQDVGALIHQEGQNRQKKEAAERLLVPLQKDLQIVNNEINGQFFTPGTLPISEEWAADHVVKHLPQPGTRRK